VTALIGGPFDENKVRARLEMELDNQRQHGFQYWPIFLHEGREHAGCCGLRPYRPEDKVLEMGFQLRPEHWGKGLASEAAAAVVDYAFERAGVLALSAGHHPENRASQRVLEKIGFRYTHDELYPPTGLQHRSYLLTFRDYHSKRGQRVNPGAG
jgi:RimJ/RimL family protein N-acetyltransferase